MQLKNNTELFQIGKEFHTDKSSHNFNGITYMDIYSIHFESIRFEKLNIMELGIRKGSSLRAWEAYFSNSNIFGIDIHDCSDIDTERIKTFKGHQNNSILLKNIIDEYGKMDIIIDDCSHLNQLTIESFNILWPDLNEKGLYIIEDLRNSYSGDMKIEMERGKWPGRNDQLNNTCLINNRKVMNEFFFTLIKNMDNLMGDIHFVNFYPMLCIIGKTI